MSILSRLRRGRPDHRCRAPGCPGSGDTEHLMCPNHRAQPVPDEARRSLVNPGHNSHAPMFRHTPTGVWDKNREESR